MGSSPYVFELMIHHVEGDRYSASLLRHRLRQDGIRAGVSNFAAAKLVSAAQSARHSLCLVGSALDDENLLKLPNDRFDIFFLAPKAEAPIDHRNRCHSYGALRDRLANGSEDPPISSPALRRATRASYDAIAAQFTDVWFDTVPCDAMEIFLTQLPGGATILDAGCGPGHHARYLKKAGFDLVGLDFSQSMLRIARKKNQNIPFIYGDILSQTLPTAYFDGVWSAVALNHIPVEDLPQALANLVATLKFGGVVGLNFQVARPSEVVSRDTDHRFFEYPADARDISILLEALGVRVVATHVGTTTRNIHGLSLQMCFATVVGRKAGLA
ncbi:methyltransferase domain-containing protein [Thauera sp.]|uniref:class I SAM-dependent DNA methyltransferase n=1 Tax=Thauera sp. TaxID=1905334 RepID=UPI002CF5828A|nr:methyltransferase domain-containing protein [Thauera sp.]HRP25659.1 methyltransferase domain-containing protein [Thauera sp.]